MLFFVLLTLQLRIWCLLE